MTHRETEAWRRAIFEQYASERREAQIPNFRLEPLPDVTRYSPIGADDEAFLAFARFSPQTAERRIREELGYLRDRGWEAEWKVHDFDEPTDLKTMLEAQRLRAHHVEALMVLEAAKARIHSSASNETIAIEEVTGSGIDELAWLQEEVWECRIPWLAAALRGMLEPHDGAGVLYCARTGKRMVASGWIYFHRGSRFAQLGGGAVLQEYRGRGIYSQLFNRRVLETKARGVPFIAVDAAPLSRPILERKGFEFVCHTYPMRTRPFDAMPITRG